ncbi:YdcH family protein [Sphingomonas sp. BK481]|uniref:YdcH family protein n=1 Tax=Sphingomonas sp. BK481 TaxID=2586981 RepID=UPI0016149E7A|nr:YdcH family protein [Sphingomonas sp. BK481]
MVYSGPQHECRRSFSTRQTTHQAALETKHQMLDRRISEEVHRPMPDALALAGLKKQKLRLKEELANL